jgi:propanediol dehydratase small subunit
MKYPLGEYEREKITSKTGKKLDDINLEEIKKGNITGEDIKISKEMLRKQGQVAMEADNPPMARNFERAAELVDVPDEVILKMYNMLRPNRATKAELLAMADELNKNTMQKLVRNWCWRQPRFTKREEYCFETDRRGGYR